MHDYCNHHPSRTVEESIRHFFAGKLSSHSRDKGFRKQLWSLNTLRRHGVLPQCARVR